MGKSVDDLKSELTRAVQELSALTKEYNSKSLTATPLDRGPVPSIAPKDLTVLLGQIQEATRRINELEKQLYGDSPLIVP